MGLEWRGGGVGGVRETFKFHKFFRGLLFSIFFKRLFNKSKSHNRTGPIMALDKS